MSLPNERAALTWRLGRNRLEASRDKQIRLLSAYETRRSSEISPFLVDPSCPRHSGAFLGRRCPEQGCAVCGGPGYASSTVPPSAGLVTSDPRGPHANIWCRRCTGSLLLPHRPKGRCPCVVTRGARLTLTVLTFSQARATSGPYPRRRSLRACFTLLSVAGDVAQDPSRRLTSSATCTRPSTKSSA